MTQEIQTKTITAPNPSYFAQYLYEAFQEGYEYDPMQPAYQRGRIFIATLYKKNEGKELSAEVLHSDEKVIPADKPTRGRKGKHQEDSAE